ncbi:MULTISPECIES: FitA-like ribbon-helix-helix domain-containing protein [unclassified Rhizobium]|uniref:FitA-like ribbon-helix-helix domain-containing protein n=1 Tax=unclassified Rhizobium TaxID=2613769 RepID=UPI002158128C|nr:plasmid stabilization protein [Rhizobium sp. TH2]UVC09383.1 plasmid stabilization protein [Rhizobium sp. TH2]
MGDLLIRNVPEDLKRGLGQIASSTGRSMSDAAREMLRRGILEHQTQENELAAGNPYEQLRALFAPFDEESDQFSEIMDEIEQQRKKDFGRPFSFEE